MAAAGRNNRMGKYGATSYLIGNIVGSGAFIAPTSILMAANSVGAALVIWVGSAVIATLGAMVYIELGTSIRRSGGDYAYLHYVGWRPLAFSFMSMGCLYMYSLTTVIQSQTFAEYVIQGVGIEFSSPLALYAAKKLIGFSLIWLLLFLNFFSLRTFVARFQIAASVAKVLACSLIIATGLYYLVVKGQTAHFEDPFSNSTTDPGTLMNAIFSGLFSYDGWDILNFGIEEVDSPRTTLPFAIFVAMLSVTTIFLAMQLSFFTVLSVPEFLSSNAVATTFAQKGLSDGFQYVIPFSVCVILVGSLNGTLFTASRWMYAAARARQFPAFASCLNLEHDSPRAALYTHICLAIMFSFLGDVNTLIGYVGFSQWAARCCTLAALLWIRRSSMPVHPEAIRLPLVFPLGFLAVCLSLVIVTIAQDFETALYALAMFGGSLCIYALFVWDRALHSVDAYRRAAEWLNAKTCVLAQLTFNGLIHLEDDTTAAEVNNNAAATDDRKSEPHAGEGDSDWDVRAHRWPSAKVYPALDGQ